MTLAGILRYYATEDLLNLPARQGNIHHNREFFKPSYARHVVDCGAYVGDSLDLFLKGHASGMGYHAFEPDPMNFRRLESYVSGLDKRIRRKLTLYNQAVGEKPGRCILSRPGVRLADFRGRNGTGPCHQPRQSFEGKTGFNDQV